MPGSEGGAAPAPSVEQLVREALRDLRYGSVEIVVHDSRVVQIERREKLRIPAGGTPAAG